MVVFVGSILALACGSGATTTPSPVLPAVPGAPPELASGADGSYWVRGTESASLLAGLSGSVVVARPVGGVERIELPTGSSSYLRERHDSGGTGGAALAVAGPASSGTVVFVDDDIVAKTHRLMRVAPEVAAKAVYEAHGSAMFTEKGEHLALDRAGERAAYVHAPVEALNPGASHYFEEGTIELCTVRDGNRTNTGILALDDTLGWTPDGTRLVFVRLMDRVQALREAGTAFEADREFRGVYAGWSRLPEVCFVDPATGVVEPICIGHRPILSPDGTTLIVQDVETRLRKVDIAKRTWVPLVLIGAVYPGPIAFVEDDVVLYPAWPTVGEDARWTSGSPVAGARQDRTLKVARIGTDEFATVAREISIHSKVSFGAR